MSRYDIAIIGTGPAGLEAAITAIVRNKNIILFGNADLSSKVAKAHSIQNYLGLPDIPGAQLAEAYKRHLDAMGIEITEDKINAVYAMGDFFALQGAQNVMYEAETVILATGVVAGKPLPGEEELLGRGVSYCATCDAALYRGKSAVVIGYGKGEEAEAEFLAELADKVYYVPVYKKDDALPEELKNGIEIVKGVPQGVERTEAGVKLALDGGELVTDGVFILREAVAPGQLVPGLATEGPHIVVNRKMETNLPGCFACGDITGTPYQYIKSAGEGNVAALSAAAFLDEKKR
jgi:thioredoxin reductase (NADPH)